MILVLSASILLLQVSSYQLDEDYGISVLKHRQVRQLGLGSLLRPSSSNQSGRRGPVCEGPGRQKGKCLAIDQCVLKELDEDYIKNKGYLCAIRPEGPVGVCCPDSIAKPVVYREGMFGNKNLASGKTGESENSVITTTPEDVELV